MFSKKEAWAQRVKYLSNIFWGGLEWFTDFQTSWNGVLQKKIHKKMTCLRKYSGLSTRWRLFWTPFWVTKILNYLDLDSIHVSLQ